MTSIIELARQYLTPDVLGTLSDFIGESGGATGSLVSAAVPMLLAGMAGGGAPGGMDVLVKAMAPSGVASPAVLDGLPGTMTALAANGAGNGAGSLVQTGSGLLSSFFGDKTSLMTKALAGFSGTSSGSATTVLGILTPVVLAMMGKSLAGSGQAVSTGSVLGLLNANKGPALAALPAPLKSIIAGIPGLGALIGLPAVAAAPIIAATPVAAAAAGGLFGRLLPWILGALALALLAWFMFGRTKVDVATCNAQFKQALAGKSINFDTGDAIVSQDSRALIGEIAEVANRCQAFRIEIAGHTDTVGDPEMNKLLSQRRAEAVRTYLVGKGVPAGLLTAVGYGAERPAIATGNEVAMAANRRIEFTVTQ